MQVVDIRGFFASLGRQGQQSQESLPIYSGLPATSNGLLTNTSSNNDCESSDSISVSSLDTKENGTRIPRLSRFLAGFTLGFADGLTVPFALTAGLSSLGETSTVICAGIAEICAGCISMGISGYLAAQGERAAAVDGRGHGEKLDRAAEDSVQRYLARLDLPPQLLQEVRTHIDYHPDVQRRLRSESRLATDDLAGKPQELSPVVVGFSISFGYLLGGLLPLFPYFLTNEVVNGLKWSFVVCIVALFIFGFVKDYLLYREPAECDMQHADGLEKDVRWKRFKSCWLEGMRMVVLGGIAALAAVVCVRVFEDTLS
ncbi:VIT family-domain-containing protein [Xylariaceae sp. FL0662B]|nr:VIT family-domain-containing protein [Xylariaceae sp. FL0662B]